MVAVNDNGFIPESDEAEGYVESRSAHTFPLKEVMRVESLAIARDVRNLATLRRELHNPNAVLRYWAASGLRLLGAAAAHENRSLRTVFAAGRSAHVKLMLAAPAPGPHCSMKLSHKA